MTLFAKPAVDVFAPAEANGTPRGADMGEVQAWGVQVEYLANLAYTSSQVYSTRAALYANLVPAANTPALVIGDPTPGNDGLYMKVGATTTGSWNQRTDYVPGTQFVVATDSGAGTPNAIVATTNLALSSTGHQLVRLNIYEENTGSPVTVTFNGNVGPLTIKNSSGSDVAPNGLQPGGCLGYVEGSTFRLVSQQAADAIIAQAEDAAARAEAAADEVEAILAGLSPGATGLALITSTTPAQARAVIKGDTYINVKDHFGVVGDNGAGDSAKMQTALDTAPIGSTLFFPSGYYATAVPLVMSRHVNIMMEPEAQLIGYFTGASAYDLLQVAITTAPVAELRTMLIQGGKWFNIGGDHTINFNPTPDDYYPHFETTVRNGQHSGGANGIRIGGANAAGDTNFCNIYDNNIFVQRDVGGAAVQLDNCADGHRITRNLTAGYGTAVKVNVVLGAFNVVIDCNALVNRDGAMLVTDGSHILFLGNQCEQQLGVNALGATVIVQGNNYDSSGVIIKGNNFGGGTNVNYNIAIERGHHCIIDENQMNITAIADVDLRDQGGGHHADYNTIGGRNTFRGARSLQTVNTDANRRMIIAENAACVGNRGIWRSASGLTYSNGWAPDNLRYLVDDYSILHWEGHAVGGTLTAGTAVTTMPAWARPVSSHVLAPVATPSGNGIMTFATNGVVGVGAINMPNVDVSLSGVSYPVNWMDTYDVGP